MITQKTQKKKKKRKKTPIFSTPLTGVQVKKKKRRKKKKKIQRVQRVQGTQKTQGVLRESTHKRINNIRISLRIAKKVTSITLNTSVIGLWMVFCTQENPEDYKAVKGSINEFVYSNLDKWERPDAKGLSEYILNLMIKAILKQEDFKV